MAGASGVVGNHWGQRHRSPPGAPRKRVSLASAATNGAACERLGAGGIGVCAVRRVGRGRDRSRFGGAGACSTIGAAIVPQTHGCGHRQHQRNDAEPVALHDDNVVGRPVTCWGLQRWLTYYAIVISVPSAGAIYRGESDGTARELASDEVNVSRDPLTPAHSDYAAQVISRVNEVRQRIEHARAVAPTQQPVTIVAVTKTYGVDTVLAAYASGVADIGENKVQEAEAKMALTSVPLRWHLIGHLQRNKARSAVRFDVVHSIDSVRLAKAVNEAAADAGKVQDVLMQVNVVGEASKGGVALADVAELSAQLHECAHLRVTGAMTMAPFDANERVLREVFAGTRARA